MELNEEFYKKIVDFMKDQEKLEYGKELKSLIIELDKNITPFKTNTFLSYVEHFDLESLSQISNENLCKQYIEVMDIYERIESLLHGLEYDDYYDDYKEYLKELDYSLGKYHSHKTMMYNYLLTRIEEDELELIIEFARNNLV